ncbi:ABC transporter permease [Kineosporia babensis]|uniref:FtsX-like permease family protein n=1 Tax=Kineosporia babensis TaxID=499548 RepID=A0A9X1NGH6_9ACTN|nr:FtsX-like permease family protein [Kineosporia babensis]MCD5312648.1 FtsX-like permease family protein [Kineosporia babensis]
MFYVARKMARRRIAALIAVVSAVVGGAALITITGVLGESGLRSHPPLTRLAEADILISANQTFGQGIEAIALPERAGIPASLVEEMAALPGVESAFGDVSFPAAVIGPDGQPVVADEDPAGAGHGWISEGSAPPAGQVALSESLASAAGLAVGDNADLMVNGNPLSAEVFAVTGSGISFPDEAAARYSGDPTSVDLIGLKVASGSEKSTIEDAVAARWPDLAVASGAGRGDVLDPAIGAARALLLALAGSMAGITLLLVGFIVTGALGVSIDGQRRELALLRAVGATPLQIRRLAAGQATVAAAVALVPGIAVGYLLAEQARRFLVHLQMLPEGLPLALSPIPALATAALLLLTVQIAARSAAWRISRRPATEAVAESRTEAPTNGRGAQIRNTAGLLLIVSGLILSVTPLVSRSVIAISSASLAGIIAAIGLALAGPTQLQTFSQALTRRLPSRISPTAWLAVSNVHGYSRRFAGAVTTLAMAVVFVITYTFTQTSLMQAQADDTSTGTSAQYSVSAAALGGVPEGTVPALSSVRGVEGVAAVRNTTLIREYQMLGEAEVEASSVLVAGPEAASVLDLGVRKGSLDDLTGATVAAGAATKLAVGDETKLILGDGAETTAQVVAVYNRDLGFGGLVASADLVAGHTASALPASVLVRTDGSAEAEAALTDLVAQTPGLALGPANPTSSGPGDIPAEVWINLAAIGVLLGYLLLGITNKLVAATTARRAEFATLRLNGSTPAQIRSMTRREAGLITAAATVTGLALAAVPMLLLGVGLLGRPYPAGPIWLVPVTVVVVAVIGFASIELATRQALRLPPAEALAQRD